MKSIIVEESEKPSECLLKKIQNLLNEKELVLNDIDVFSAVIGPGSFTGTRIGLSTVYGFCYGLNKKFIKINLFDLLDKNMVIAAHAGGAYVKNRNKAYFTNKEELEEIKRAKNSFVCIEDEKEYFDNAFVAIDLVEEATKYVSKKYVAKEFDDIFSTEPFYIEKSQAENSLEESLKTFKIKKATRKDVEQILNLENVCFSNNKYSKETIISEISKSFNTCLVGLINDEIVCFGIFSQPIDEGEIIQICVIDKFRRMGFAKKLFKEYVKIKHPKKVFLEVNKNNDSAINLYHKLGFNQIATRKNYYENGDDCLVFVNKFEESQK